MTERHVIRALLIEDDAGDVEYFKEILLENEGTAYEINSADRLKKGIELLSRKPFDIILLDLNLPDSKGIATFNDLVAHVQNTPIVVVSGLSNQSVALEAVQKGAQDYLVKGEFDGRVLARVIPYAIERHRMQVALRSLSIIDDLTGLYNRRGFLTLAQHHLKLADRTKKKLMLFFVDVDSMKQINDTYGHQEGDDALIHTAEVLKKTFRSSDVIARLGGDEFIVLMVNFGEGSIDTVRKRLEGNIQKTRQKYKLQYELSLSSGTALLDPTVAMLSIEDLMKKADQELYAEKRKSQKNA